MSYLLFIIVCVLVIVGSDPSTAFSANPNSRRVAQRQPTSSSFSTSSTALYYVDDTVHATVTKAPPSPAKKTKKAAGHKIPTLYPISTLQELYDFLQEDDRLTAIKIYAPWCKKCHQVGLHFRSLASQLGDGVLARKVVRGKIRCACIEYGSLTASLITEKLKVEGVPTLHLYKGTKKLWQSQSNNEGHPNKQNRIRTSDLKREVKRLLDMPPEELDLYAANMVDDGILEEAMEDSFFDNSEVCW